MKNLLLELCSDTHHSLIDAYSFCQWKSIAKCLILGHSHSNLGRYGIFSSVLRSLWEHKHALLKSIHSLPRGLPASLSGGSGGGSRVKSTTLTLLSWSYIYCFSFKAGLCEALSEGPLRQWGGRYAALFLGFGVRRCNDSHYTRPRVLLYHCWVFSARETFSNSYQENHFGSIKKYRKGAQLLCLHLLAGSPPAMGVWSSPGLVFPA